MSVNQKITIKSGQGSYDVDFFENLDQLLDTELFKKDNMRFVVDKNVFDLYHSFFNKYLAEDRTFLFEANEEEKTLQGAEKLLTWLQETKSTKKTEMVVIGGGITQDVGTFSASIYYRGIKWHLVPTTLLSMGDSCIGAKSGLNLNQYKNQIGNFYSPSSIMISSSFCKTLKEEDLLSGHGEILKLALIDSMEKFDDYKSDFENGMTDEKVNHWIYSSLETKRSIIEEDEYESDLRRVLNYGHSFGHAIESVKNNTVPHGIAVAVGIDVVNFISMRKGFLSESSFHKISDFIKSQFPNSISGLNEMDLIAAAKTDKKVVNNTIFLSLLGDDKGMFIQDQEFNDELAGLLKDYIQYRS